jgi:hypothetical protein
MKKLMFSLFALLLLVVVGVVVMNERYKTHINQPLNPWSNQQ